jgi:hypothetical protein
MTRAQRDAIQKAGARFLAQTKGTAQDAVARRAARQAAIERKKAK